MSSSTRDLALLKGSLKKLASQVKPDVSQQRTMPRSRAPEIRCTNIYGLLGRDSRVYVIGHDEDKPRANQRGAFLIPLTEQSTKTRMNRGF